MMPLALLVAASAAAQPRALETLRIDTGNATIPVEEVMSGGPPPQGIPAIGFDGDQTSAAQAT